MELDTFKTVAEKHEGSLFKDRGSKFIGYVFPILSEEEVKPCLEVLKKKHHAARHWCYAWSLGVDSVRYRANDDGEPNNSAGQPIYGQLLSKDVTNALVVVVRYFGGTKLGVGGLINAYKTAAKLVLDESVIVEKTIDVHFDVIFEYKDMNKVMRLIKEHAIHIESQKMELNCHFKISIRKKNAEKIERLFNELRCLKIKKINP